MLSGCCVVTVPGNDVDAFITNDVTGYIVDGYSYTAVTLDSLLHDPEHAWKVGQAGREMARSMFHKDRFVSDWLDVLGEVGVV